MIKLITGEFCSRCHLIAPKLKEYAEKNNITFEEVDINNASPADTEGATMLPIIIWDGERVEYDDALARVM